MGMFYKTPEDLKGLEMSVGVVAQQMSLASKGMGDAGFLDEMMGEAIELMSTTRVRLLAEGRSKDLKAFRKQMLYLAGGYMDNGTMNHHFRPFVLEHLAD